MSDDPYRQSSPPPREAVDPMNREYVSGGMLKHDPKYHCKPPGWWARWRHNVNSGDKWQCTCGVEWEWCESVYIGQNAAGSYYRSAWKCLTWPGWDPKW